MDVAFDHRFLAKLYLVACEDVAIDGTINLDVASLDVAAAFYAWHKVKLAGASDVAIERTANVCDF